MKSKVNIKLKINIRLKVNIINKIKIKIKKIIRGLIVLLTCINFIFIFLFIFLRVPFRPVGRVLLFGPVLPVPTGRVLYNFGLMRRVTRGFSWVPVPFEQCSGSHVR